MPRETREKRAERLAQEKAAEQEAFEKYLQTVPKRLMDAQALAQSVGVSVKVELEADGPVVHFEYESGDITTFFDDRMTYHSPQWELENLEERLAKLKRKIEERDERLRFANTVWERLSTSERAVVKEFIYMLRM